MSIHFTSLLTNTPNDFVSWKFISHSIIVIVFGFFFQFCVFHHRVSPTVSLSLCVCVRVSLSRFHPFFLLIASSRVREKWIKEKGKESAYVRFVVCVQKDE